MSVPRVSVVSPGKSCQVFDRGIHSRDVFVHKCSHFNLRGRCVGNEILPKSRERIKRVSSAPEESHVRRENLIPGADKVIALPLLHVDGSVGSKVNSIEENFGSSGMGQPANARNV